MIARAKGRVRAQASYGNITVLSHLKNYWNDSKQAIRNFDVATLMKVDRSHRKSRKENQHIGLKNSLREYQSRLVTLEAASLVTSGDDVLF